jgi:hypothetical protein
MTRCAPIAALLMALFLVLGTVSAAFAQSAPGAAETDKLIETLKDPKQRDQLLRQLEILRAAQEQPAAAEEKSGTLDNSIAEALSALSGGNTLADPQAKGNREGGGALVTIEEVVSDIRTNIEESWQWLGGLSTELGQLDRTFDTPKFRAFWASLD